MKTVRWIALLPGAVCGYLAYLVGGFINNLSITLYRGAPLDGLMKVAADVMTHMYLGGAFTCSAVRVAASTLKYAALAAFVLILIFADLAFWSSFAIGKWHALPTIGGVLFSGAVTIFVAFASEIVPHDANRLKWRR